MLHLKHLNNRLVEFELNSSAIADEVRKLKQEPGKSLLQYGIGELTKTMLKSGLIDEIHGNVFLLLLERRSLT